MHGSYSASLGIDLASASPMAACTAYVEFLLAEAKGAASRGQQPAAASRCLARLAAALAPCMRLYRWLAVALAAAGALETTCETYQRWISEYSSQGFGELADELDSLLDACFAGSQATPDQGEAALLTEMDGLYVQAMEHELAFFGQFGLDDAGQEAQRKALLRAARIVPPRVLIVAGSDSGGGAGIQADMKACAALGAFSTTAIAALTAQNSAGVQGIYPIPVEFVQQQMRSVLDDLGADVIKTGMLATSAIVRAVVAGLEDKTSSVERWRRRLVVDPVMVSTSGHQLLEDDAVDSVKRHIFPIATIITPNLREASLLLEGRKIDSVEAMKQAAVDLCAMGPRWVLLKGGHMQEVVLEGGAGAGAVSPESVDVLCDQRTGKCETFGSPFVETTHTHGTGCTLASSVAALLARGSTVPEAVREAKGYVHGAIASSAHLALGSGPQGAMNHSWQTVDW